MGWPALLVLVRHAESQGNVLSVDERAQCGQATHAYPLTEVGCRQAEHTREYLRRRFGNFDVRYSSYYVRAAQTIGILCPDQKVYEDPRLAEAQRGIYHTYTGEEAAKLFPGEERRREREGLYHFRPLGGENWPDVELRIHSFLGTLSRDYGGKRVLVVVHGHWLLLFQRLVHHFSIDEAVSRYHKKIFDNASVTAYQSDSAKGRSQLILFQENYSPWKEKP